MSLGEQAHRVQIKLRGRRFEFEPACLLTHSALFRSWYEQPADDAAEFARHCRAGELHPAAPMFEFRRSVVGSPGSGAAGAATVPCALDVFDFGADAVPESAPDYFGAIQISMRKNRRPPFCWDEMNRMEQQSVAWIVNGMMLHSELFAEFAVPTAAVAAAEPLADGHADDFLPAAAVGCHTCGLATHAPDECPHRLPRAP